MLKEQDAELFARHNGVSVRRIGVLHCADEYDEHGFDILFSMQREHFWYHGRHRFLLAALEMELASLDAPAHTLSAIDLGAGCGGWIDYLLSRSVPRFGELALADSSLRALEFAATVLGSQLPRFQVDLRDLGWKERWDIVFLLDVLEHIQDHNSVVQQICQCLRPNGLLFLTVPALDFFWSYNDELARHQRRYSLRDIKSLSCECELTLTKARYFMFFLSPLLYFSRFRGLKSGTMSRDEIKEIMARTHRIPSKPVNALLKWLFALETPLGLRLPFPWGTSVLSIFQKPMQTPRQA
jgi:2-polyprenyl-3-methyl-5-hydroxy-6-metoxy-1,4-benzoquinol methylase